MSDVIVDGVRLEVIVREGTPGRPTVVFLHEGLGSISQWRDFPDRVKRRTGCGVAVYSRRGYGASAPLARKREPDYMHREADVVLPAVLDALGIERPILLGHSDGASIALLFAGTFPERPRGVIVEAPHLFVEDISIEGIVAAKVAYETGDLRGRLKLHHADVDRAFRGWNDVWLDERFRTWNIEDVVANIEAPVLAIQGENDAYGTVAQLRALEARVPGVTTVLLERCGHAPHRDRPDAVDDAVASFVARL